LQGPARPAKRASGRVVHAAVDQQSVGGAPGDLGRNLRSLHHSVRSGDIGALKSGRCVGGRRRCNVGGKPDLHFRSLSGAHLRIRVRRRDLRQRQQRQGPFRRPGNLHLPFVRGESAHFHPDFPNTRGKFGKHVSALDIGQHRHRLVALPRRYRRSGHRKRAEVNHVAMLGGAEHAGGEQHDHRTPNSGVAHNKPVDIIVRTRTKRDARAAPRSRNGTLVSGNVWGIAAPPGRARAFILADVSRRDQAAFSKWDIFSRRGR
jgi:hypothetical protein